jgi:two-component system, sensor histidine kinase and response regulator
MIETAQHLQPDVMATNALESTRAHTVNVDAARIRAGSAFSWVWRITPVSAAIAFAIGAVVLLSWATGTERFALALPGFILMIPNTALGFVVASLSLWFQRQGASARHQRIARAAAWFVLLLGFASFLERTFGIDLGIDLLLFRDRVILYPYLPPGRMATNSTICFILAGASLLLLDRPVGPRWPAQWMAAIGLAIAAIAIIGYTFGATPLYAIDRAAGMALLTAIAFTALHLGILFARPDRGAVSLFATRDLGGLLLRATLPVALMTPALLGFLWLLARRQQLVSREIGVALFVVVFTMLIVTMIVKSALALRTADRERDLVLAQEANARAHAEEANRAKSEFLATISHELRTPLNAIIGYASLLREGIPDPVTPAQGDHLDRVTRSATHLLSLIDDVLSIGQVEASKHPLTFADLPISTLVEDLSAMISPLAQARHLRFDRHFSAQARDLIMHTDAAKLRQCLLNLLANAVKFTDHGAVTLTVSSTEGNVEFRVEDTGRGIAPEHLESIFEPFWQVERSTTRTAGGAGLGLAVTRRFSVLLGGQLAVSSVVGRGSSFTLTLPLRHPQST